MKKLVKLCGIIALAAIIGFSMVACNNGTGGSKPKPSSNPSPDSIVGTWEDSVQEKTRVVFTATNWTMTMPNDPKDVPVEGTYTYSSGTAALATPDKPSWGTATVSGNSMKLTVPHWDWTVTITKQ